MATFAGTTFRPDGSPSNGTGGQPAGGAQDPPPPVGLLVARLLFGDRNLRPPQLKHLYQTIASIIQADFTVEDAKVGGWTWTGRLDMEVGLGNEQRPGGWCWTWNWRWCEE